MQLRDELDENEKKPFELGRARLARERNFPALRCSISIIGIYYIERTASNGREYIYQRPFRSKMHSVIRGRPPLRYVLSYNMILYIYSCSWGTKANLERFTCIIKKVGYSHFTLYTLFAAACVCTANFHLWYMYIQMNLNFKCAFVLINFIFTLADYYHIWDNANALSF